MTALGEPSQRILDAMVWLESGRIPMPWHRTLVAYAARHLPRSGAFKGCVAQLRESGLVTYRGGGIDDPSGPTGLVLEHEGRELATQPSAEEAFSGIRYWLRLCDKLNPIETTICAHLRHRADGTPGISRAHLLDLAGGQVVLRDFRHALAKLLAVDLIAVEADVFTATTSLRPLSIFELRRLREKTPGA
jgi:hypothetical protein